MSFRGPRLTLPLAIAFVFAAPDALAQPGPADLDTVLVTATRTPVALDDSLVPAQIITRADIEHAQATSLTELLRGRAGIDIGNQGGPGKISSVFIRGSEADHVLVLVDGVRMGSATAGTTAFQDLPVEQIERIEVVRGPRSSLYGSEAIGGVIQIFTRRDSGAVTPRFRVATGSNGLREGSAGVGGGVGRGWFGADLAYQRTDGIDACRGTSGNADAPFGAGCFTDEPDRDGYRNRSANLRGGVRMTDAWTLEATALRAESENEFDGSLFGGNEAENVQQAVGATLRHAGAGRVDLTLRAGRSDDKSDNFFADAAAGTRDYVSTFDTRRDTASAQADIRLAAAHLLTLGVDWQDDAVESTTAFDVGNRDNTAAFVEYQGGTGRQRWQASVRNDDNEQFGNHTTGSVGWGFALAGGTRLRASYGTGFKAPSFNDLYYPFFSNPDLRPEESRSLNVGIGGGGTGWQWGVDAYQTRIDDLISYDAALFLPNNIEQARIRGIEATLRTTLAGWDVATQLSHADPRNRTPGANHDNLLARRARTTGRIDVDRRFGSWRLGTTVNGAGSRYDNAANTDRLGGHATADIRIEYALAPAWTLQARASNVFDRAYETVSWYNQPGREYLVSVRYAPAP
ncbi:MAG TPA: TonB-dependent vitamin B12 receptor [Luteimonas sp.]|nr:TonB-dependent vitamin B12 receptor [Luteimonas sp.]